MNNNELAHVGVMGMKWGHTKGSSGASSAPSKKVSDTISRITSKNKRGPNSTDYSNVASLKGKNMNSLSNAQLKMFNERVQLEKTYKSLNSDRGAIKPGIKIAKDILIGSGKQVASAYITKNIPIMLAKMAAATAVATVAAVAE